MEFAASIFRGLQLCKLFLRLFIQITWTPCHLIPYHLHYKLMLVPFLSQWQTRRFSSASHLNLHIFFHSSLPRTARSIFFITFATGLDCKVLFFLHSAVRFEGRLVDATKMRPVDVHGRRLFGACSPLFCSYRGNFFLCSLPAICVFF